ncbi:hypothetical protein Tcan_13592 [Toxocara canis]|uniref:CUB domain-containing protein n=1 Tax=Toxocara canis TaxID=6265 RepID=A0A0B2VZB8_TOXCA|nr:hypothetical protein Tcan_13592 [Toxocara canis]
MGWKISTALFSVIVVTGEAVLSYDPQINYFDGTSYTDTCRSKLERRVSGLSGLLISHQLYGTFPYNASKNCFLLITAPVGYRIRLRVLDFNVLGDPQNCDKDTLHVFDHEKAIDPSTLHEATPEDTSPGPIVGQFCGIIRNASELAISSENALTLWWHSDADLPPNHSGEGFRLLWSAFRKSNTAPCNTQREFTCANQECIPSELACNRYPDCKDESDLLRARQIAHRCDCCNTNIAAERTPCCADLNEQPTQPRHQQPQPTPPGFYPPSPPKLPPPSNATAAYSPQRTRINSGLSVSAGMPFPAQQIRYSKQPGIQYPQAMVVANEYGSPTEQANLCTNSDYTYPRNEARHLLI